MRSIVCAAGLAAILLWAAYALWRDPRLQDLLRAPAPAERRAAAAGSAATSKKPVAKRAADEAPEPEGPGSPAPAAQGKDIADEYERLPANTTPNEQLSRVLLQILAARKLTQGISISVSDRILGVGGTVDSEQKKKDILEVLEKARESRIIDASDLLVRPEPPGSDGSETLNPAL